MAEHDEERRGFQVKDRRRFSESGEARSDVPEQEPTPSAEPGPAQAPPPRTGERPGGAAAVTFSTFVLGLSTQALLHLGEIPDPVTHAVARDLDAAKQVIDILGILREKTRNNLEPGEDSLLESVLYDLRMRFVELARGGVKEGK
jgi:uncharacterized protein DUF1844